MFKRAPPTHLAVAQQNLTERALVRFLIKKEKFNNLIKTCHLALRRIDPAPLAYADAPLFIFGATRRRRPEDGFGRHPAEVGPSLRRSRQRAHSS